MHVHLHVLLRELVLGQRLVTSVELPLHLRHGLVGLELELGLGLGVGLGLGSGLGSGVGVRVRVGVGLE